MSTKTLVKRKTNKSSNNLATTYPEIAAEWCYELNEKLTPNDLTYGSEKVVWWKCPECGCVYQASVNSRTTKYGPKRCPECPSQHGTSFPEQTLLFYLRRELDCHVESRARVTMCGKTKEIDVWIPSLMTGFEYDGEYFHSIRNRHDDEKDTLAKRAGIRLIRVIESDHRDFNGDRIVFDNRHNRVRNRQEAIEYAVNLICSCIVDIEADMSNIMSQYKSAEGERSLAKQFPDIAKEWDKKLNGKLTPDKVSYGTGYSAWWRCPLGHSYQATVNARTHLNSGCPYCANRKVLKGFNDLATTFPSIAAEWHPTKNHTYTPETVTSGSSIDVWWKCSKCGYEWKTKIINRTKGSGCPVCAGRVVMSGYNDLATKTPKLAREWHPSKNNGLEPSDCYSALSQNRMVVRRMWT